MTPELLERLKKLCAGPKVDAKIVKIICADEDVLEGFIDSVDDGYREVIFCTLRSNRPEKYKVRSAVLIDYDDITNVEELSD
jgi:hypothetical protein